jgi:hypothetical protein
LRDNLHQGFCGGVDGIVDAVSIFCPNAYHSYTRGIRRLRPVTNS